MQKRRPHLCVTALKSQQCQDCITGLGDDSESRQMHNAIWVRRSEAPGVFQVAAVLWGTYHPMQHRPASRAALLPIHHPGCFPPCMKT
jgi:hypothetical protein